MKNLNKIKLLKNIKKEIINNINNNSKSICFSFIFLFTILMISNSYASSNTNFDENLLFKNLYLSQLEINEKYSDDYNNYINNNFVYNTLQNRINEKKNNEDFLEVYISKNNYFFYKSFNEDVWILKYNTKNLLENGFKTIKTDKISNIVFSYNPNELKKYECYENFIEKIKNELNQRKEILFVMDEQLSGRVVSSVINFGRFFVKGGIFYQKDIIYGTIQGNNSNKLTLDDLTNNSLMFHYIKDDYINNSNYCEDLFFDEINSNLIHVKDKTDILRIFDYLSMRLIGVKI
ncbi:MAG: hypothetical protein PHT94_02795 [Candidatus Nanoarchaeia archaeon]|nr:hypothetical protein [Candidatus Nanoarchaeia archaeon]